MGQQPTSLSYMTPRSQWSKSGSPYEIITSQYGSIEKWLESEAAEGRFIKDYEDAVTDVERWEAIRAYYAFFNAEIASTPVHQWATDPYALPVHKRFTPIEKDAWDCIRIHSLVMYPQYPACGYFLDFAHPVLKVAIEMDGKQWHDPAKDAQRDNRLIANGWTVYRIPGGHCMRQLPLPEDLREGLDECTPEYQRGIRDWYTKTSEGVITAIGIAYFNPSRFDYANGHDYYDDCDLSDVDCWTECRNEAVNEALTLHRSVRKA